MKAKGFTFMEFIIVLAILSCIIAIGLTQVKQLYKFELNQLANQLEMDIKNTQQTAHLTGETYLIEVIGNQTIFFRKGIKLVKKYNLKKNVKVQLNTKEKMIIFRGNLSPAKGGTFTLQDDRLKLKIELPVQPVTGRIEKRMINLK